MPSSNTLCRAVVPAPSAAPSLRRLVRVGGGHSVTLAEAGRQLVTDAAKPQPSSGRQRRQPAGTSARGAGNQGKGKRHR